MSSELLEGIISRGQNSKIVKWQLENCAQYENETFDFKDIPVMLLKGFNSVGKSNALKGLEFALTTKGLGITFAKDFIRWGALEARVKVFFDDGVTLVYVLKRASLSERSKFTNGYHLLYTDKEGITREVYSSKVNGAYTRLTETPEEIRRYLNLAIIDKKTLNVLRKSDGLSILEVTPTGLMRILSQVTGSEDTQVILKRMKQDQKASVSAIEDLGSRIEVFTEDIENRRVYTEGVEAYGDRLISNYERKDKVLDLSRQLLESLEGLVETKTYGRLEVRGIKTAETVSHFLDELKGLTDLLTLPKLDVAGFKHLETVSRLLGELETLGAIETHGKLAPLDLKGLDVVSSLLGELERYNEVDVYDKVIGFEKQVEGLDKAVTVYQESRYLSRLDTFLEQVASAKTEVSSRVQTTLGQMKYLGHPVSRCLTCGELTLLEEVEGVSDLVGGLNHKHEEVS